MPPRVALQTTLGRIEVELYPDDAPRTVHNFVELSRKGYYDGVVFHRVIQGFCAQTGDPTGTGTGGESVFGATFEDECSERLKHTGAGILSMANAGQNTNGSQFFITLAPLPHLDGKHTVFGRVASGMAVVEALDALETNEDDRPVSDVRIERAEVLG